MKLWRMNTRTEREETVMKTVICSKCNNDCASVVCQEADVKKIIQYFLKIKHCSVSDKVM